MMPKWPLLMNEVVFSEFEGKTTVIFMAWPINATEEELEFFAQNQGPTQRGLNATFDHLEEYLTR